MAPKTKKIGLGAILASVVFTFVFSSILLYPAPAKAQYHDFVGWAGYFKPWTLQLTAKETEKSLTEKIKEEGLLMVMSAIMNGLNYFTNKIAYDMGVWLASGDFGQGPFASSESFGNYIAQTAGDSLGEALFSLSADLGLNLCDLPDLRLDLLLQLGFHFNYDPPEPRCTWQQLKQAYNVENVRSQYFSKEGLASRVSMGVQVSDTDFGVLLKTKETIDTIAMEQTAGGSLDRQEGNGIFPMADIISGKIRVPATVMKEEWNAQSASAQKESKEAGQMTLMGAALQKGGVAVAMNTVSTFINTLLGTVLNNFITKGLLPGGAKVCNPGLSITGVGWEQCDEEDTADTLAGNFYSSGAGATGQRRAAQELFSEYLLPKIKTVDNFNVMGTMADCSPDNLLPEACTIDQSFLQILQEGEQSGEPLTIKQALERGYLHGDWPLISYKDEAKNSSRDCALSAYCHRNIQFLRLMRILPLGFEIAAGLSAKDNPTTLKGVVDNYYSGRSDFYGLINPHWVIKYPKTRCNALVYSSINMNGGIHLQTCADIQHCVSYNKDGSCASWGYCLREQPIWKFNANTCDRQFNTCRAFTSADGDTGTYLMRTLNTENCSAGTDGCTRYSKYKYYLTPTVQDWFGRYYFYQLWGPMFISVYTNSSLFFTKKMPTCEASQAGCSAFKLASNLTTAVYLKKAPDYLGCYDADSLETTDKLMLLTNKISSGVQWPQTLSDLNLIQPQDANACKNYAQVCLPEEENCNFYTSALTGDIIPGKFTPAVVEGGMVTWNDQCDAKCVGYAAYREMPSNYANGENLSYIIPSSGKACSASEAGCTSFTNLSADQGGLEQNEYFSYLRPCALPDQNIQRNYTVYESSESGGYQIKTYTLVKNNSGDGPKQIFRDEDEYGDIPVACSASTYGLGTADPDCHQFIDGNGNIHYALLSKTIVVTDQCTPYRLNNTEMVPFGAQSRCPFDYDPISSDNKTGAYTVEFKNNACYYMGFTGSTGGAGDSAACSKGVDTCRSYKGNAGNNVHTLYTEDFESDPLEGWTDSGADVTLSRSSESTQIDGHSLKVSAVNISAGSATAGKTTTIDLLAGKQYVISFWIKGDLEIESINFGSDYGTFTFSDTKITPSAVWKSYSFGPVDYEDIFNSGPAANKDSIPASLVFALGAADAGGGQFFMDNIKITEVDDYLYLVKNSLAVDPICDSSPNDNLPGEALGCMSYTTPVGSIFNLTNFSYLCREAAVGCTALLDTFNTPDDPDWRVYNIWLAGISGGMASVAVEGKTYSCQVPVGETGCYTNMRGIKRLSNLFLSGDYSAIKANNSTVIIPADTPTATPIYLVANQAATCRSENMGCELLGKSMPSVSGLSYYADFGSGPGLQTHYETFADIAVKNDPALYDTGLCQAESAGCKTWASGESAYYFKDPVSTGNLICQYKEEFYSPEFNIDYVWNPVLNAYFPVFLGLEESDQVKKGWVWKDVGACMVGETTPMGRFCASDSDCLIADTGATGTCKYKGVIPCYPGIYDNVVYKEYPVVSYGTTNLYHGFAGECPDEQSGCSQFVDHSSSLVENKICQNTFKKCSYDSDCNEVEGDTCVLNWMNAYYLLENEKLSTLQSVCNGQVSEAEGCVLLDKTSNPNKYWHTTSTYDKSVADGDKLVIPVDLGAQNDANTILKVVHDRECGQWAYCDLKQEYEDEDSGEISSRCYHLGVCYKAGIQSGMLGQAKDCTSVVANYATKYNELSAGIYRSEITAWDSMDFSGYSVYGTNYDAVYQIPDLTARKTGDGLWHLVHSTSSYSFIGSESGKCSTTDVGTACGPAGFGGKCYNGECLVAYSGGDPNNDARAPIITCRAYAEAAAPFMPNVFKDTKAEIKEYKEGFEGANVCMSEHGNPASCDYNSFCSYRKLQTDGGEVYKQIDEIMETQYVCGDGPEKGNYCNGVEDTGCGEGYACGRIKSMQVMSGWMGYCMTYDPRQKINGTTNDTYCMNWWPIQVPPGVPSFWEDDPTAGFEVAEGDKDRFMCLENEPLINKSHPRVAIDVGRADAADFPVVFPKGIKKNNAMLADDAGGDYPIGIEYVPDNAAIIGCNYENSSGKWDMMYSDRANGSAVGWYCPVTTRNTYVDDASQWTCDGYTAIGCALDGAGRWVNSTDNKWLNDSHSKYIAMNEIERIDVVLASDPGTVNMPKSKGYVSFIRDNVDADENRSFILSTGAWASDNGGGTEYHTSTLENLCLDGKDWKAWTWEARVNGSSLNWLTQWEEGGSAVNGMKEVAYNGICDDKYKRIEYKFKDDKEGFGMRIVFDDRNYFRGIWFQADSAYHKNEMNVGYFIIIHFSHGYCKKYAQFSTTDSSAGDFKFKPYTNNLRSERTVIVENHTSFCNTFIAARTPDLNGGGWGLAMKANGSYINPSDSLETFVNPFITIPAFDYCHTSDWPAQSFSQSGSMDSNYDNTGYAAGISLINATTKLYKDGTDAPYYKYGSYSDFRNYPYGKVLKGMYAKNYNFWQLGTSDGWPNSYATYHSPDDAADPDSASDSNLQLNLYPPRVAAPNASAPGGWELDKISVGDQTSGNITVLSGTQLKIKFYAWAHGNQMPIRRIIVRKGDAIDTDVDTSMRGSIGNRKPLCTGSGTCGGDTEGSQYPCNSSSDCDPIPESCDTGPDEWEQFGNTAETGCKAKLWDFSADYNCPFGTMKIINRGDTGNVTIEGTSVAISSLVNWTTLDDDFYPNVQYVCVAQPKVYVLDNWGWCASRSSSAGGCGKKNSRVLANGCYVGEETTMGEYGQCTPNYIKPWVKYNGYVIVVPLPANF